MSGSVFDFGDVFGSVRFESRLQSDVNKQLFCNLVMLMNCNYFYSVVFGSMFYSCDMFGSVFNYGDMLGSRIIIGVVYGLHNHRLVTC